MDHNFIEKEVRSNRLFILGAGFSAAAGVPLTASLLDKAARMFAAECPGIFSRIDNYARECLGDIDREVDYSRIDFSDFCTYLEYIELREYGGGERWKDAGSREKLALRFFLSKTIAQHTPAASELPQLYIDFASQLHPGDKVITFNWDALLEIAILRIGKHYTYNSDDENAIKLYKLHGSVNWRLNEPSDLGTPVNTLGWRPIGFASGLITTEIYQTPELLHAGSWDRYQPLREVEPFLVLPGYGKAFDVRSNASLWYKPEFAFSYTHDVFIIGLSLAPDDFFIRSFFLANLPFIQSYTSADGRIIYIINPSDDCKENYRFVLSNGQAKLLNENFSAEHIALMKREQG